MISPCPPEPPSRTMATRKSPMSEGSGGGREREGRCRLPESVAVPAVQLDARYRERRLEGTHRILSPVKRRFGNALGDGDVGVERELQVRLQRPGVHMRLQCHALIPPLSDGDV